MKTFILGLIFLVIFLASCSVDNFELNSSQSSNFEFILNDLRDSYDLENDIINEIQFHFANASFNVFSNKEHEASLKNEIRKFESDEEQLNIDIIPFLEKNLEIKEEFNKELLNSIQYGNYFKDLSSQDIASALALKMIHKDILYHPVWTVFNIFDNEDLAFGIGQEIDDSDNIYYISKNEINKVNEQSLEHLKKILLVVNNDIEYQKIENYSAHKTENVNKRATVKYNLTSWQVKNGFGFEGSGATDYRVKIREYVTAIQQWQDWHTESISTSDVSNSTIFTGNIVVATNVNASNHHQSNSGFNFSLFTFEYDWYSTSKPFDCSCSCENTTTVEVSGLRKFLNDFYDAKCGPGSTMWGNLGETESESDNTKSTHSVLRTNG